MRLDDIHLGKVDGKFEFVTPTNQTDRSFYDAFLLPKGVQPEKIGNHDRYFVEGFRGTGKTSLLRWFAQRQKDAGATTEFILFKTEIAEAQRQDLSTQVGISWQDVDAKKMEFSQDFKEAWSWFLMHKLAQVIDRTPSLAADKNAQKLIKIAGIRSSPFKKVMGFLPRLEGLTLKIGADLEFFKAELGAEFEKSDGGGKTTLPALTARALELVSQAKITAPIYILFDELEVFYDEVSKYHRDQRMVRDLLFSISIYNDRFRRIGLPVHFIAAVRSEVIDGFGAIGQEVERLVHDKGVKIAWHFARRSTTHPLFEMISNKIKTSDPDMADLGVDEVISNYFPLLVRGEAIDEYMLDRSFYRPRDLIWRLTIIQKQFPDDEYFTERAILDTEGEYSTQMWEEIAYELSANYSASEIQVIEMILSGAPTAFDLIDLESKVNRLILQSENTKKMFVRVGLIDVLQDLYRLGAIGNFFRTGPSGANIRNRWAFRGDPTLLPDKRMTINPSLEKRLSTISPRRRGSQGTGR